MKQTSQYSEGELCFKEDQLLCVLASAVWFVRREATLSILMAWGSRLLILLVRVLMFQQRFPDDEGWLLSRDEDGIILCRAELSGQVSGTVDDDV